MDMCHSVDNRDSYEPGTFSTLVNRPFVETVRLLHECVCETEAQ